MNQFAMPSATRMVIEAKVIVEIVVKGSSLSIKFITTLIPNLGRKILEQYVLQADLPVYNGAVIPA